MMQTERDTLTVDIYLTPQELGDVARQLLDEKGYTQAEAGRMLGVAQPTIADALRGDNMKTIRALLETLAETRIEGPYYKAQVHISFTT